MRKLCFWIWIVEHSLNVFVWTLRILLIGLTSVGFNIKKFFCSILIFSGQRSLLLLMEIEYFYSLKTISFIIFRNIWLKYFSSQKLNAYLVKYCPKSALWSATVKLHNPSCINRQILWGFDIAKLPLWFLKKFLHKW